MVYDAHSLTLQSRAIRSNETFWSGVLIQVRNGPLHAERFVVADAASVGRDAGSSRHDQTAIDARILSDCPRETRPVSPVPSGLG